MVKASGEPLLPAFADLMEVYNAREQSAAETLKVRHNSFCINRS